jgi:hypothetical protein
MMMMSYSLKVPNVKVIIDRKVAEQIIMANFHWGQKA